MGADGDRNFTSKSFVIIARWIAVCQAVSTTISLCLKEGRPQRNTVLLVLHSQGHLKVEAFYRSRPVFRVSPAATHEKQEKRVFAGSDTLSPGQRSSRSSKGPTAPCNPAFAAFKSPWGLAMSCPFLLSGRDLASWFVPAPTLR